MARSGVAEETKKSLYKCACESVTAKWVRFFDFLNRARFLFSKGEIATNSGLHVPGLGVLGFSEVDRNVQHVIIHTVLMLLSSATS